VARGVRAEAERQQLLAQVQAGLDGHPPVRVRRSRRAGLVLAGVAATFALGTAAFLLMPRSISFVVSGQPGVVGAPMVAPANGEVALRFSDGSSVTLPAQAAARVEALEPEGATVAVDTGTVDVAVVHRLETHWELHAGNYRIKVTGTRFRAIWNRNLQELTVLMREGSVVVSGPGIAFPTRVVAGERLRANADEGVSLARVADQPAPRPTETVAVAPARAEAAPEQEPTETPAEVPPTPAAPPTRRRSPEAQHPAVAPERPRAQPAVARPDWRALATRAQYRDALTAAIAELQGEGWTAGCSRLGVEDVVLLGDVARLAGDLNHADEAYRIARQRFPGTDRPTFALGLIAFEGRHDYRAAAGWFEAYLRRYPTGPLAREAAGRLLESHIKGGADADARDAAAAYLRDFPSGPHADLARRTVGR
jgi:hypothetical protein